MARETDVSSFLENVSRNSSKEWQQTPSTKAATAFQVRLSLCGTIDGEDAHFELPADLEEEQLQYLRSGTAEIHCVCMGVLLLYNSGTGWGKASGTHLSFLQQVKMKKNADTEEQEHISRIIDASDFTISGSILHGDHPILPSQLDNETRMKLHYCFFGGWDPILGQNIPLEYLSCDRVTEFNGRYTPKETFFTFNFINYSGGARGNKYSSKSLIPSEHHSLGLSNVSNMKVKIRAYQEILSTMVEFRKSGEDLHKPEDSRITGAPGLSSFTPLPSYATVMDRCVQTSLKGSENWVRIKYSVNEALVLHLLSIRLTHCLKTTNCLSKGQYQSKGCQFACEEHYLTGAQMVARCETALKGNDLLDLVQSTNGVGERVMEETREFLRGVGDGDMEM
ncbi:hypothetical protein BJ741DRAFT_654430 [Chytriomyces cf. hyalinus JEL632]|nr:hypothetical protein BJ741DRAFT_654430 [Chytriomyces cf. hyalinus JEL632]